LIYGYNRRGFYSRQNNIPCGDAMEKLMSAFGLVVMMVLAWAMSSNRKIIPWRVVIGGVSLQIVFAWIVLKTTVGKTFFAAVGDGVTKLLDFVDYGSLFVFGQNYHDHLFAFKVLPTIIFFSAFMSLLYHIGIMQAIVRGMAYVMHRVLKTSGAETLAAALNVFVGQTEAPLVVKPYIESMTRSELMAIMVGGFANIAGGVLAAYVSMGIDAGHLLTASVISAPASLFIAKLMEPETEVPLTRGNVSIDVKVSSVNFIDALTAGASEGLHLALNVGAMLIAFLGIIALLDASITWLATQMGFQITLATILGKAFAPLAWVMGVPFADIFNVGQLLGLKMVANEFIAYEKFSSWLKPDSPIQLSERARIISTYALCGFANFGSIGIQLGGISPLAPSRRAELARLGLRAMLGGTLATFTCACVAGMFL